MVTTKHLDVGYGKKIVLKDVEITVEPGRILTLIGPNGSGKSTVLKSLTNEIKKISGDIYVHDKNMADMKREDIARLVSMVMTDRIRPELMTCREIVATGRYPYTGRMGILTDSDWRIVEESMSLVNADKTADMDFNEISDGQRQRVMLARAIAKEPEVLILDEPTSYLDMKYKLDILKCIRKMAKEKNIAVIMSLHELDLAQKISDTIACVDGKKIERIGSVSEVFKDNYIQKLYGVEDTNFSPLTGNMYVSGGNLCDEPKVFVISGGGFGIHTFYSLYRDDVPFAAGIISENDIEYETAMAMAVKVVATKAFYPISKSDVEAAKRIIDKCEKCICCIDEFGPLNKDNMKLLDYAKETGKLWQNQL